MLFRSDTTATPGPVTITITALGRAPDNKTIRRGGAKLGDLVFVTGTIGDAGGGLAILKGEGGSLSPAEREALVSRYRLPEPRLAFGQMLIGLANSSLDVSDGLFADLGHIADASRARIVFAADKIPLSDALKKLWGNDALLRAAACGDDYEIAFTAPPDKRNMVLAAAKTSGLPLSEIGRVETGEGIILRDEGGTPLPVSRAGYKHF